MGNTDLSPSKAAAPEETEEFEVTAPSAWARDGLEYLVAVTVRHVAGGVIAHFDAEVPLATGDVLHFSGQPKLEVVGFTEQIEPYGWFQLVEVRDASPAAPTLEAAAPHDGEWPHVLVTVRDARFGRDPALATTEGGEVLDRFRSDLPLPVGQTVMLPDGTAAPVIAAREVVTPAEWLQVVEIGDAWPSSGT